MKRNDKSSWRPQFTTVAIKNARLRAANGFFALLALAASDVVGAATIIVNLPWNGLQLGDIDPATQSKLGRAAMWAALSVVALVGAFFAWRISRLAILVGFGLLAVEWADWAIGFSGRARFTTFGLIAFGVATIMMGLGLSGAVKFHRLKHSLKPEPLNRLYPNLHTSRVRSTND